MKRKIYIIKCTGGHLKNQVRYIHRSGLMLSYHQCAERFTKIQAEKLVLDNKDSRVKLTAIIEPCPTDPLTIKAFVALSMDDLRKSIFTKRTQ